jgi:SMODS-associated and fused to various effectors sensor domain
VRDPRRELASPSAARLSGDDYQHVFTLMQAVRLLREDVWGVTRILMEVGDAGNVDDLVVEYRDKPTLYHQIKFSRVAGEPLKETWFTDIGQAQHSPLWRFRQSFENLTQGDQRPQMALVTNRTIAPDDPILRHLEGRDGLLTPRLAIPGEKTLSGKARAGWAKHLDVTEKSLLEMLDHLEIHSGMGSLETLREHCAEAMLAAGLRGDIEAVTLGHAAIRDLIEEGCDQLDAETMRELVGRLSLAADHSTGLLSVAAIDHVSYPDSANVALDWVDHYVGEEPRQRRQLADPDVALVEMTSDLKAGRRVLEAAGYSRVRVGGAFRLDTAFAIGAELSDTAGYQLSVRQREELWSSEGRPKPFDLKAKRTEFAKGDELAVCISISNELDGDVANYIERADLPIDRLVCLVPATGAARDSIIDAAAARGCVQAALDSVRIEASTSPAIHLFLSAPGGVALLLGHVWNRLPETRVYADLSPGYEPSFQIRA